MLSCSADRSYKLLGRQLLADLSSEKSADRQQNCQLVNEATKPNVHQFSSEQIFKFLQVLYYLVSALSFERATRYAGNERKNSTTGADASGEILACVAYINALTTYSA